MENKETPLLLNPGDGKEVTVGASRLFVKLFSEQTNNRMTITEYVLSPNFPGPPPHKHKTIEHAWYVLEGTLSAQLEDKETTITAGGFVFIPKRLVHAFSNKSEAVVRLLAIDTPGGFEKYYDELQAAFGDGKAIDQQVIKDIQLKYDTYPPDYVW
jgi:quercetin dioxygenase-like cupin family protein